MFSVVPVTTAYICVVGTNFSIFEFEQSSYKKTAIVATNLAIPSFKIALKQNKIFVDECAPSTTWVLG